MTRYLTFLPLLTALLFCIGLMMVFNTTSAEIIDQELSTNPYSALIKQLSFALFGFLLCFLIWRSQVDHLFESSNTLFWGGVVLLLLVYFPGIGHKINGANRWVGLKPFVFQPSEFMKVILPLYTLHFLSHSGRIDFNLFLRLVARLSVPLLLILLEPDNGTTAMLILAICALFFLTKIPVRYWALPLFSVALIGGAIGAQMTHVTDRIRVYLNPELDLLGRGHQPYQAKIAAGSGQLFGRGLGESLQKLNYLPEARSDYIAAIYAEEFGFLGMLFLIVIFMMISFLGFTIGSFAKDENASCLAHILTFTIAIQGFVNLGVVSGLLPSKGTNLPFFSQGGSSLVANMIALTIIIKIGKEAWIKKRKLS
ncbi:MAG: putative peptidoglycan glycosyltransferase FtsW [Simkaniaceae bacterium]